MRPEEIPNGYSEDEPDHNVKLMKVISQVLPLFSHPKADVCQEIAPGQRADKGKQDESREIHLGDASRQ